VSPADVAPTSALRRRLVAGFVGAACVTAPRVWAAEPRVDNEMARYWRRRVAEFGAEQAAGRMPRGAIVLLGDSMTERFALDRHFDPAAGRPLVNRGIGGDKVGGWRYWGLLDRLETTVLPLAPHQVVLMIGVNDLVFAHTPADLLHAATERLVQRLAAAVPHLLVQTVLPVRGALAVHNSAIVAFNERLAAITRDHRLPLLDLAPTFRDAAGELRADRAADAVHLNDAGYRQWAGLLAPWLRRTD
jgi:lysophospholipase L1-like esterase